MWFWFIKECVYFYCRHELNFYDDAKAISNNNIRVSLLEMANADTTRQSTNHDQSMIIQKPEPEYATYIENT